MRELTHYEVDQVAGGSVLVDSIAVGTGAGSATGVILTNTMRGAALGGAGGAALGFSWGVGWTIGSYIAMKLF